MDLPVVADLRETLARIEQKLDVLIAALAAEEEDAGMSPVRTLDGAEAGGERDVLSPL